MSYLSNNHANNAVLPQSPGSTRTRVRLSGRPPRDNMVDAGLSLGTGGRPHLEESARVPAIIARFEATSRDARRHLHTRA